MHIFLDTCRFLGNYQALSEVIDVIKRRAKALHTNCTFHYCSMCGIPGYCIKSVIYAGHLKYIRNLDMAVLPRYCNVSLQEVRFLSINIGGIQTTQETGFWHLVKVNLALRSVVHVIKKSAAGQPILQGFFDPYLQNVVLRIIFLRNWNTTNCGFSPSTNLHQ